MSCSVAISLFSSGVGWREGADMSEIWGTNMTCVKLRSPISPHELCGKICYCPWPPTLSDCGWTKWACESPVWVEKQMKSLGGQNRQSPIASVQRTQPTLASHTALPRGTNAKWTNANCAIRNATQWMQGLWGLISVVGENMTANER